MSAADGYNATEYVNRRLTEAHVAELLRRAGAPGRPGQQTPSELTALVEAFQRAEGMTVDGMAGPKTRAALELLRDKLAGSVDDGLPALTIDSVGWLAGEGVTRIASDPSWYYARLKPDGSIPAAIVAHYSATAHGTAVNMAKHRAAKRAPDDRPASWHLSIEGDGSLIQMAPFRVGCWHAGGPTSKPIPGLGGANHYSVGIELIGDGSAFSEAQVRAACRAWRALVLAYRIPRGRAMVTHQELDPTRKRDPGALWMSRYAPRVLAAAGI